MSIPASLYHLFHISNPVPPYAAKSSTLVMICGDGRKLRVMYPMQPIILFYVSVRVLTAFHVYRHCGKADGGGGDVVED